MTNPPNPTATITRDEMKAWLKDRIDFKDDHHAKVCIAIRDALSTPTIPAVPEGYVLVPEKLTNEIADVMIACEKEGLLSLKEAWAKMLAAAPTPPCNGMEELVEETERLGIYEHQNATPPDLKAIAEELATNLRVSYDKPYGTPDVIEAFQHNSKMIAQALAKSYQQGAEQMRERAAMMCDTQSQNPTSTQYECGEQDGMVTMAETIRSLPLTPEDK